MFGFARTLVVTRNLVAASRQSAGCLVYLRRPRRGRGWYRRCVRYALPKLCCNRCCASRASVPKLSLSEHWWNGVVAQLVERLVRNEKVAGSIPVGSTIPTPRKYHSIKGARFDQGTGT